MAIVYKGPARLCISDPSLLRVLSGDDDWWEHSKP
jgi:hypothetical protein